MRSILQNAFKVVCSIILTGALVLGVSQQAHAQVTTSSMGGKITDENGEPLIGATVIAVHAPSGTRWATMIQNLPTPATTSVTASSVL